MKKRKILSIAASAAMVVGLFSGPLNKPISAATGLPSEKDGKITLTENIDISESIVFEKDTTLDLNGYNITSSAGKYSGKNAIVVNAGTLTIEDSKGSGTISSGETTVKAANSGKIIINSGNIKSTQNGGILALGNIKYGDNSSQTPEITVNGGTITGQEGAAFVKGRTAKLNINGGTLTSIDNFCVLGNGSKSETKGDQGGYEINITGGTITGNITSPDYIAGGIYHPNYGTLNISGGTIKAVNGAGIVARGGTTNITGGTIQATGTITGMAGDAKPLIGCHAIAFDTQANYPGFDDSACINVSGNATFSSDSSVDIIKAYGENSQTRISLTSGTYSNNVSDFTAKGYSSIKDGTSYKVVANTTPDVPTEPTADVKEVTVGTNTAAADTIKNDLNSVLEDLKLDETVDTSKVSQETQDAIKAAVEAGKVISSSLEIEPSDLKDISTEVKNSILGAVKTDKTVKTGIASYLDFTIIVTTEDGVLGFIDELNAPIKLTVAIPKNLQKEGRTFTVVREHNGVFEELATTVNADGTISFETDRFSSYALVYKDSEVKTNPTVNTTTNAGNGVDTGDHTNMALWIALLIGSIDVFAIMALNKKRNLNK